jgi:hypothetical protein
MFALQMGEYTSIDYHAIFTQNYVENDFEESAPALK